MAQGDKSRYYQALKSAGYSFDRHYREYTAEELKTAWDAHAEINGLPDPEPFVPKGKAAPRDDEVRALREELSQVVDVVQSLAKLVTTEQRRAEHRQPEHVMAAAPTATATPPAPVKPAMHTLDPNQHAGVTLNTHRGQEVLEIDEHGNQWYQKEVTKPAFPKPRGRRVLRYNDPGVAREKIKVGDYVEEFEVAGDAKNATPSEIKITLPSYQTGIYKPPNMPFRVHTYNGVRGFDLFDVQEYYGGADLVPDTVKRCYVSTDLCYDIQSTIRAIENEYRERVLRAGRGL